MADWMALRFREREVEGVWIGCEQDGRLGATGGVVVVAEIF